MKSEHLVEGQEERIDHYSLSRLNKRSNDDELLDRLSQFSLAGTVAYGLCTYDEEG